MKKMASWEFYGNSDLIPFPQKRFSGLVSLNRKNEGKCYSTKKIIQFDTSMR